MTSPHEGLVRLVTSGLQAVHWDVSPEAPVSLRDTVQPGLQHRLVSGPASMWGSALWQAAEGLSQPPPLGHVCRSSTLLVPPVGNTCG